MDRRIHIVKQFEKNNFTFSFFDAFDFSDINDRFNKMIVLSQNSIIYLSKGAIGCKMSNIGLWETLLKKEASCFLIFEDDVILSPSIEKDFNSTYIPSDFDIVFLGSGCNIKSDFGGWVNNKLYIPVYPRKGTYGYLISKKGISKILKHIYPITITAGGIDTIVGRLVSKKEIIAYHFFPPLCTVDKSFSSNILI